MTTVPATERISAIQEQLNILSPIIQKATNLYNSTFLTASIWITAEHNNEQFQELLHFPCSGDIPRQLKDFFADYCILLVSLQQNLQQDLNRLEQQAA